VVRLKHLTLDRSGSVGVQFALTLVPFLVAAGGAVDYSRATQTRAHLQASVDAAAIHAAQASTDFKDPAKVVQAMAPANVGAADVKVTVVDDFVTVVMRTQVKTAFAGVIGVTDLPIEVKAVAARGTKGPPVCVLALNASAPSAVEFAGNTTFSAKNCAVYSNSASASAITLQGSARADALAFCAVGGTSGPLSPTPQTGCRSRLDPFRHLTKPVTTGCDYAGTGSTTVNPNTSKTFSPGIYCGKLDIKGTATLKPGVYVLKEGLSISSQASVTGSGVTLYLTGSNATFTINGGGKIHLAAPTTGSHAGILIHQDSNASPGATNKINGTSDTILTGAIYAPTQVISLNGSGSFGQLSEFMPLIADKVAFSGNSVVETNLTVATAQPMPTMSTDVRLVR
jgi:Flp pilus assembly protein TadG